MKAYTSRALAFLATMSATNAAFYDFPSIASPVCVTFEPIKMKGDAGLVGTSTSGDVGKRNIRRREVPRNVVTIIDYNHAG